MGRQDSWDKSHLFYSFLGGGVLIQPFSALLQRYRLNLLKNKKIYFIPSSSFGDLMPWKVAFY